MLRRSAENLIDHGDKSMISPSTEFNIISAVGNAFIELQEGLEAIDEDLWTNEWRCDFSNRMMHKSKPLQDTRRCLIQAQKQIFKLLDTLTGSGYDYLTGEVEAMK